MNDEIKWWRIGHAHGFLERPTLPDSEIPAGMEGQYIKGLAIGINDREVLRAQGYAVGGNQSSK